MRPRDDARGERSILLSRFLTHSGDQAWDFALPLALIALFPSRISIVALYYFLVRLGHTLLVALVCGKLDRWSRMRAVRVGLSMQTMGVAVGAAAVLVLSRVASGAGELTNWRSVAVLGIVVAAGLMSSLGAAMMDVAVSQDWIPALVPATRLAHVNGRMKQIDLGTELGSPVVAGAVMAAAATPIHGFLVIGAWNLLSFLPEYRLLLRVLRSEPELAAKPPHVPSQRKTTLVASIAQGWRDFMAQPAALSMLAYALLWLTVLSPHGVLLTAWLKVEWGLSESAIGLFRGLGAVFGLLATVLFPRLLRATGLFRATSGLIVFEALCVVLAGVFFYLGQAYAVPFIAAILLSRIGLYGFSLGETEIRQTTIPGPVRGKVNGFANALTSLATLGIYGVGALLKETDSFGYLVYGSIACVALGATVFVVWSKSSKAQAAIEAARVVTG